MGATSTAEVFLPREIADAAGVPLEQVLAAVGGPEVFLARAEAVRLARALRRARTPFIVRHRRERVL